MSYIDWNSVKESRRGGSGFNKDGRIYFRDGSEGKTIGYRMTFAAKTDVASKNNGEVRFGVGQNSDFFITLKNVPNVPSFKVTQKGKSETADVYGKDLIKKAIKTLVGITPSGNVAIDFNLKKVDDTTYKFTDVEIL